MPRSPTQVRSHRFVRYRDKGHMFITDEVITQARKFIDSF